MNPTPEQIQRKIAEVQGWTDIIIPLDGYPRGKPPDHKGGIRIPLPNWPTDRDESYKLIANINFTPFDYEVMSAYDESLLYLETEGWRWVECNCKSGKTQDLLCPDCNGEGGEWVKV